MTVPEEIAELIESSGNSFHSKVARWLVDNDWHVTVSPYYLDQSQGKAREIDIVAEKDLAPICDDFDRPEGQVVVRLFVECKYVASSSVFWLADKDIEQATELVCRSGPFRRENAYTEQHHYMASCHKVAKIFASSKSRQPENEPFYRALNQVLNATVSLRGRPISIPGFKKGRYGRVILLEYPVVICSSFNQIYAMDFYDETSAKRIENNYQLEVSYAYIDSRQNSRNEHFLIDFVEFAKLPTFVDMLQTDAKLAAFFASKT